MIINTFNGKTTHPYAAFDFETRMYVDGVVLSDEEIFRMCGENKPNGDPVYPQSWWREHTRVECWAWIIYTPDGFAIAETFEEWLSVIQKARISCGWFYNAPFDFSILDYAMLSRGWKYVGTERPTEPYQYSELASDFGARYTMTISAPYKREKGDRSKRKTWSFRMYDLRNILHGGLEKLLDDFDVRDGNGRDIRKLKMDYQAADGSTQGEIDYMLNDAAGLWWLIQKAGAAMMDTYGLDIRGSKPDVLTASGMSKKVLLKAMYPDAKAPWFPQWKFRKEHAMTLSLDAEMRRHGLLGGGLVVVNPNYKGMHIRRAGINRYDVNSEYPAYMHDMRSICSAPLRYPTLEIAKIWEGENACYVLAFKRLSATVKRGAVPCWRDPFTHNILPEYDHRIMNEHGELYMFLEEFEELQKWYDFHEVVVSYVYAFKTRIEPAIRRLIGEAYEGKATARAAGNDAKAEFYKLFQNGLGGKYSQNPKHGVHRRILTAGDYVAFTEIDEEEDEKSLMNVVQGARITCGGRIMLRRYARLVCGGVENTAALWLYGDTDSLHVMAEAPTEIVDPFRLGALKKENKSPIVSACFLAPKTYYEIEERAMVDIPEDETMSADIVAKFVKEKSIELHAKGVNKSAIIRDLSSGRPIRDIYTEGATTQSLSALNVPGGKALLPFQKVLLRPDFTPDETHA